jgi:hypothetical protein
MLAQYSHSLFSVVLILFLQVFVNAENHPVAFCHFATTDYSYLNGERASSLAELAQLMLQDASEVTWVDRADVNTALQELSLSAISSESESVALGHWLEADLLVKGVFEHQNNGSWILHIEIVDLRRADVLAKTLIRLNEQSKNAIPVSRELAKDIALAIREHLATSNAVNARVKNQILIAPLQFLNVHKNGRFDFLEEDIQHALATKNNLHGKHRYLQFPRTEDAVSESNLVSSGMTQTDQNKWQRIADYFIWGSYQEFGGSGVPFDEIPIQIDVEYWNGDKQRGTRKIVGTAGKKTALIDELIRHIEAIATEKQETSVDLQLRKTIASSFLKRAIDREPVTLEPKLKDVSHHTDEWIREWRQTQRVLSLAAFFDPTSELICREYLIEHTRDDVTHTSLSGNHEFWRTLELDESWGRYFENFGDFDVQHIRVFDSRPGATADNRIDQLSASLQYLEVKERVLEAIYREIHASRDDRETDVPHEVLNQWYAAHSKAYLARTHHIVENYPDRLIGNLTRRLESTKYLASFDDQASFYKMIWPAVVKDRDVAVDRHESKIRTAFLKVGKPDVAESLIADAKKATRRKSNAPSYGIGRPADGPQSYALEIEPLAEIHNLPMRPLNIDKFFYVQEVTALKNVAGQLWCGVSGQDRRTLDGSNALFSWGSGKWQVWHQLNTNGSEVTSILGQDNYVWFTFADQPISRWEASTGKITRFDTRDGAPSLEIYASCHGGDRLWFGGGDSQLGVLAYFDLKNQKWSQVELGSYQLRSKTFPMPRVEKLAATERWTAVYADMHGAFNQLIVLDQQTGTSFDLGARLLQTNPEFSHFDNSWRPYVHGIVFIGDTLWIATSRGLIAFDLVNKQFSHVESLQYELCSLAVDGDHLWFGACPFRGNGTLGDTDRMTCILLFDTQSKKWLAQIPVQYKGHLMNISRDGDTLWLGCGSEKSTVVRVNVSNLRAEMPR